MPTSQSVQTAQRIAATFGETWTQAKVNQVATQFDRGQRTPVSVQNDMLARGATPVRPLIDTRPVPATGKPNRQTPAEPEEPVDTAGQNQTIATVTGYLRAMGLDELIPYIDGLVRQGRSWAEIEMMLNDPATDVGGIVDRMYPELRLVREENARRRAAGEPVQPPASIASIQQYYQQAEQMASAAGLSDVISKDTVRSWLVSGKSLVEQKNRLDIISEDVAGLLEANPQVREELESWSRFYGVQPDIRALVASVIDPAQDLPTLLRRGRAVSMDRSAGRVGFGDLSRTEAERLADLGVTGDQATAGFGDLASLGEVTTALPGTAEDSIDRASQLSAAFEGNTFARKRIDRRLRERKGAFEAGGSFATGKDGYSGLGTAQ